MEKSQKTILGIDPGTNFLGYGIIRVDSKGPHNVDMGVVALRKITDPFEKLAKIAICGNGAASKEQVCMMIQKTLKVELDPKHLDATDALAIALCHHYQMTNPLAGTSGKTDWKKFLQNNPDRIKKCPILKP